MRSIVRCSLAIACLFAAARGDDTLPKLEHFAGHKATALVFLGTECPVSNGYAPELERLYQRYKDRDVSFYGFHCDRDVSLEKAQKHAKEYGLTFPVALDHEQKLAQASGVRVVPTVVLLGADGRIKYRGRVDDRYSPTGQRRLEATTHDLEDAIKAVLDGKSPTTTNTEPFGCPLAKTSR